MLKSHCLECIIDNIIAYFRFCLSWKVVFGSSFEYNNIGPSAVFLLYTQRLCHRFIVLQIICYITNVQVMVNGHWKISQTPEPKKPEFDS